MLDTARDALAENAAAPACHTGAARWPQMLKCPDIGCNDQIQVADVAKLVDKETFERSVVDKKVTSAAFEHRLLCRSC